MGGAVSAITAAAHEEEIQGAILLYPTFVMVDDIQERFHNNTGQIQDGFHHLRMTSYLWILEYWDTYRR